MQKPSLPTPEREHVLAAFDACCGALRAVELASTLVEREGKGAERRAHLRQATEQLRQTVAELRLAEDEEPSLLTLGLVLPAPPEWADPAAA